MSVTVMLVVVARGVPILHHLLVDFQIVSKDSE